MSKAERTIAECLKDSVLAAAKINAAVQSPPCAILWTDKEGIWKDVLPTLQAMMPSLFVLGGYNQNARSGPAIWLKCAVAGLIEDLLPDDGVPIVYLPSVSRADLRAIESCARELQPLAELQYRGVYWSQLNGKDWTVNAFLSSKTGGLGLSINQDKATQRSMLRALAGNQLLNRTVSELAAHVLSAEWFDSLLAPNLIRDVLVWMNDPAAARENWGDERWALFQERCRTDFSLDPNADGDLTAAEKLAAGAGKWKEVWALFVDSYASFPRVSALLDKVTPPQATGLFDDRSAYPQWNDLQESALREALLALITLPPEKARAALREAEIAHGHRRGHLWAKMGKSSLAMAMAHLHRLADAVDAGLPGSSRSEIGEHYASSGWRVDAEAMRTIASVRSKIDIDAVTAALKAVYVPWLEEIANRFQGAVREEGGLYESNASSAGDGPGTCVMFVDGLRFDVGVELEQQLKALGTTKLGWRWTSIPSVTASGKALASPVSALVAGLPSQAEFEPSVAKEGKPLNTYNFRKLLSDAGYQVLGNDDLGDPTGKAWVECGDLDHYGHSHGLRLARDIGTQLEQIVERIKDLADAGWHRIRIVTDHGWLLIPGGLPKVELHKHQTETRWGRCAILKESAHPTDLTFGWHWCDVVQVALAPGIASYVAGEEYAHGGLTLQECLIPDLTLEVEAATKQSQPVKISKVGWKGLRCTIEIEPAIGILAVDIRTKANVPGSSVLAATKPFVDRRASAIVEDDSLEGTAASVVVIDDHGQVLAKMTTQIGE